MEIAGPVAAAAIFVIIALLLYFRRRKIAQLKSENDALREAWRIVWHEITLGHAIGRGGFGVVHKGKWRDLKVAVKISNVGSITSGSDKEIEREAELLVSVRHAFIVNFYGTGVGLIEGLLQRFLVTELLKCDLTTFIASNVLTWPMRLRFSFQISTGMSLVHQLGRIHRDLKSSNLLVTEPSTSGLATVKIADFGASTVFRREDEMPSPSARHGASGSTISSHSKHGTLQWMAPEMLRGRGSPQCGPAIDVFSFGMVMWELGAQAIPWAEELRACRGPTFIFLLEQLERNVRPWVPASWPPAFEGIMRECWATDASIRPTFKVLSERLRNLNLQGNVGGVDTRDDDDGGDGGDGGAGFDGVGIGAGVGVNSDLGRQDDAEVGEAQPLLNERSQRRSSVSRVEPLLPM